MPVLSNHPPTDATPHALTLRRVQPGKPALFVVTSPDLLGCWTHYWGGRTVPCEDSHCRPCLEGMPRRWHAYLGAYGPSTHSACLVELTALACQPLLDYRKAHGTLRGCEVRARRAGQALNSRLIVTCSPADLQGLPLPPPPDLPRCLAVLWSIPHTAFTVSDNDGSIHQAKIAAAVADLARTQTPDTTNPKVNP